jgi:hypothetical protein
MWVLTDQREIVDDPTGEAWVYVAFVNDAERADTMDHLQLYTIATRPSAWLIRGSERN